MKIITNLALAALATAFFTPVGAFASDTEWIAVDNHHGSVTYLYRPEHKEATVAPYSNGKAIARADEKARHGEKRLMRHSAAQESR